MAKLSKILEEMDISYYKLSKDLGYNPRVYCGIMKRSLNGERTISDKELTKILAYLQITKDAVDKTATRWVLK